jgi:hypothetical protein
MWSCVGCRYIAAALNHPRSSMKNRCSLLLPSALAAATLLAQPAAFAHDEQSTDASAPTVALHQLEAPTLVQLATVVDATARFQDINEALAEGYVDIDVVIPHMGRHLLNQEFLDGHFDVEHPELLVYNDDACGELQLVAVEYAVPLDLAKHAPAGFIGTADAWDVNDTFRLWTLHA